MENTDIQELARLIDTALSSDNPSVKKALRNFMLIVSIVDSENTESTIRGPFAELFNKIDQLTRRIEKLENNDYNRAYKGTQINPYTYPSTVWVGGSGTSGLTGGTYVTNAVSTSSVTNSSSMSVKDLEIELTSILKGINAT